MFVLEYISSYGDLLDHEETELYVVPLYLPTYIITLSLPNIHATIKQKSRYDQKQLLEVGRDHGAILSFCRQYGREQ